MMDLMQKRLSQLLKDLDRLTPQEISAELLSLARVADKARVVNPRAELDALIGELESLDCEVSIEVGSGSVVLKSDIEVLCEKYKGGE